MSFGSSNTESLALGHACIVGECVYICIECLKYYDKIYDILLLKKKKHLLFLNFPYNLLQCSTMILFKGLKIPKIMGWMDWLATLKVWCNLNPTSVCDAHDFYFLVIFTIMCKSRIR